MARVDNMVAIAANTSSSLAPKSNLSHPCFDCGLMFANKDDYQQHENVFHNARDKLTLMVCDECGRTMETADELANHQLEHDMSLLIKTVMENESVAAIRSVSSKPIQVTANVLPQIINIHQDKTSHLPQTLGKREKKARNDNGQWNTTPMAAPKRQMPVESYEKAKKPRKPYQRKIRNELPPLIFNDRSTSTDPSIVGRFSTESAKHMTPSTEHNKPQYAFANPAANRRASAPNGQATSNNATSTIMLSSICPTCQEDHGKPWSLIEHMIGRHGAVLIRLERKFTNEDSHSTSENFASLHCPYCDAISDKLPACLSHVVRVHREKLFECPNFGECDVCIELMSSTAADTSKRKFTIRVKVKRRNVKPDILTK